MILTDSLGELNNTLKSKDDMIADLQCQLAQLKIMLTSSKNENDQINDICLSLQKEKEQINDEARLQMANGKELVETLHKEILQNNLKIESLGAQISD